MAVAAAAAAVAVMVQRRAWVRQHRCIMAVAVAARTKRTGTRVAVIGCAAMRDGKGIVVDFTGVILHKRFFTHFSKYS